MTAGVRTDIERIKQALRLSLWTSRGYCRCEERAYCYSRSAPTHHIADHSEIEASSYLNETQVEINIRLYNAVYILYEIRSFGIDLSKHNRYMTPRVNKLRRIDTMTAGLLYPCSKIL